MKSLVHTSRRLLRRSLPLIGVTLSLLNAGALWAQGVTRHVATTGSDAGPGSALAPFRTVQRGVDAAATGDTILVHGGTYIGTVVISRASGAEGLPIVLRSAGDGEVVLRGNLAPLPCTNVAPTMDRTLQIVNGADRWSVQGLTIVGGMLVRGTNIPELLKHTQERSLPGRGLYDPAEAAGTLARFGSDGADFISVSGNKFVGRGFLAMATRQGNFEGNEVSYTECGTGAGVLIMVFSDGWKVQRNYVHDTATSSKHWMSEGIRFTNAAMYNVIQDNVVDRLGGLGRGITMDVQAGWNIVRRNKVSHADIGYSEEYGGWGNRWAKNIASDNRSMGFHIAAGDPAAPYQSDTKPSLVTMRCNQSVNNPNGLMLGWASQSTFTTNIFKSVKMGRELKDAWPQVGNTWEGATAPPSDIPLSVDYTTLVTKCLLEN